MKKYWVQFYRKMKSGEEISFSMECNDFFFQNERLGKHIVLHDCNDAETKKQYKRNHHFLVDYHFLQEYTETTVFVNGTDDVVLQITHGELKH